MVERRKAFSLNLIFSAVRLALQIHLMAMMKMMNVSAVWLTDKRRLALLPVATIVRNPDHRKSPTHRRQSLCRVQA